VPKPAANDDLEQVQTGASAAALTEVEARMRALAGGQTEDPLIRIVREHLDAGGKRLRARLALDAGAALATPADATIGWACTCELLHNASLIHDDVQDGDMKRRGRPAVWAAHGVAQAINAGDLLLMLSYRAIAEMRVSAELKTRLVMALAHEAEEAVRGQAAEIALVPVRPLGLLFEAWRGVASRKTGGFFALPVIGAAILGGCDDQRAKRLAEPFRRLGILFQMRDDVRDLFTDHGKEHPGTDLRQGRLNAVLLAHMRCHPEDVQWLLDLLWQEPKRIEQAVLDRAIYMLRKGDGIAVLADHVERTAAAIEADEALQEVDGLHVLACDFASACREAVAVHLP
jgi:geranylgeranyl diphosphate synthase, type I